MSKLYSTQIGSSQTSLWASFPLSLREIITNKCSPDEFGPISIEPDSPETLKLMDQITNSFEESNDHATAVQILTYLLATRQAASFAGPYDSKTLRTMFALASDQAILGQYAEAEQTWRELLRTEQDASTRQPLEQRRENLAAMYNLIVVLNKQ